MSVPRPELDLRQLRAFVVVAEELHFGRAALKLGIAQPPLSQQIRRLETKIGCALFERGTRHVELTEAGRLLVTRANDILRAIGDTARDVRMTGEGKLGRLVVGFPATASLTILPKVVEAYRRDHPGVELRLVEVPTSEQRQGLHEGTIDVGFLRDPRPDDIIEATTVLRERFVAVLPASHPLAGTDAPLDLAKIAAEPFVMFPRSIGPEFFDRIGAECLAAGFTPHIAQSAREWQTIVGLVSAGVGVSIAPESVAQIRIPGAAFRPIARKDAGTDIAVCWRRADRRAALRSFVRIAQRAGQNASR